VADIETRLDMVETRMNSFDSFVQETKIANQKTAEALDENTRLTQEIKDILEFGKTFFTVMKYIGVAAKWFGAIATAVVAVYTIFHLNDPPK